VNQSPSKIKLDKPEEVVNLAAKRAARASPQIGEQGELIRETHLIIDPLESLQTATSAEKVSLIVVS
jgi:hypothetical protein